MTKLVVLKLDGETEQDVRATLTVEREDNRPTLEVTGKLPQNPNLVTKSKQWQSDYNSLGEPTRLKAKKAGKDIISREQWCKNCRRAAQELVYHFNQWLLSDSFRRIYNTCVQEFANFNEEVRLLIRTSSESLWKLPWEQWDLVENHQQVGVAFCLPDSRPQPPTAKKPTLRGPVEILAILGKSTDIDVQHDRQLLENFSDDAAITFLEQPTRREFNDQLRRQRWDIVCFAGHSKTEADKGRIYINQTDSFTGQTHLNSSENIRCVFNFTLPYA